MTTDSNDKNKPVPAPSSAPTNPAATSIKIGLKSGVTGPNVPLTLRARAAAAKQKEQARAVQDALTANTLPNRIALLLDISSSMAGSSIRNLQTAFTRFVGCIDFTNTSVAVRTFPYDKDYNHGISHPLSTQTQLINTWALALRAGGGTPMADALRCTLIEVPMTRALLISDGEATDNSSFDIQNKICPEYRKAGIPVDCVHIGTSIDGESTLQTIAELTGGIYIKFTDTDAFTKALKYLTPRFRAMLTSGAVNALDIGANEIKFLGTGK